MSGKNNEGGGRARRTARRVLYGTLAASLLVHLGLVVWVNDWLRVVPAPEPERMEVRLREPEPEPEPPPPEPSGEIVDLPPDPETEAAPPEDARFLAERNSRVERETADRNRRPAPEVGSGGAPAQAQRPPSGGAPSPPVPPSPEPEAPREVPDPTEAPPDEQRSQREQVALLPNLQTLSQLMGAPAPDRLRGVEEGDRTRLNAFLHPHAVFFNRLKRAVAREWGPLVDALQLPDDALGGEIEREFVTTVGVVLDRQGEVVSLRLLRSSGLDALDESALRAFSEVGTIHNPPADLFTGRRYAYMPFSFSLTVDYRRVDWGR